MQEIKNGIDRTHLKLIFGIIGVNFASDWLLNVAAEDFKRV